MPRRLPHRSAVNLLGAPLVLLVAWPVGALELLPAAIRPTEAVLLAQAQGEIPAEVQGWSDGANAAFMRGDTSEALQLQKQVVTWINSQEGVQDIFRAKALIHFGLFLSAIGQELDHLNPCSEVYPLMSKNSLETGLVGERMRQARLHYSGCAHEALIPTEKAVIILRRLGMNRSEVRLLLPAGLANLTGFFIELGLYNKALDPSEELVKLYRSLSRNNVAYLGDLARALTKLGIVQSNLDMNAQALSSMKESAQIRQGLTKLDANNSTGLATNSIYLSRLYAMAGLARQALQVVDESINIHTKLAMDDPASLVGLARSFTEMARLRSKANEKMKARSAIEAGTLAYMKILRSRPQHLFNPSNEFFVKNNVDLIKIDEDLTDLSFLSLKNDLKFKMSSIATPGSASYSLREFSEMILTVERSINRKDIFWSKLKLRDVQKKFNDVSLQFEALDDVSRLPASKLRTYVVGELLFMQEHLPSLSEVERRVVAEKLDKSLAFIYSLAWKGGDIASLSLLTRLNRNQLLLDIERRQAISARATGAAHVTLRRLTNLTILLSNPMVSDSDLRRAFVESQRVQKELWRILPELQPRLVEPSAVAKQLPADGMLIEFQRYAPFDPLQPEATQWGSPRYLAMVLGPSGLMQTVDLGSAEQLEQRITTALERTRDRVPEAAASWGQVADYVFLPLQSSLAGRRRLLISPDGALHRVPFGALALLAGSSSSLPAGVWLQTIGSGRDLVPVASANPQTRSTSPLVLAAPTTTGWEPLPAAIKEGSAVASSLRTLLHQGEAAKVALLEQARGPKLIHVAGHGYFDAQASGDPLLASGLVLAGADRAHLPSRAVYSEASGGAAKTKLTTTTALDDGYLTAKEAARLQLDGTELVVLSACETGLGQERTGEGLFGLQRALTVAGARGTLLSLWKVPDQASQTFMERFYALLKQGKAADQAVRQVQEEFRDQPTIGGQPKPGAWSDPYYWAAWQYTGVPDSPR